MRIARFLLAGGLAAAGAAHALDVTFTDITSDAGVGRITESYGASIADVDGDTYPDIFVSNHRFRPSLYINQRNGRFVDIASQVEAWVQRPDADTHGGGFADIDNDGDQDLLVSVGRNNPQQLLVNHNGRLIDEAGKWTVGARAAAGRMAVWFDYDNDGLLDLLVPQYDGPSPVFTNLGDRFSEDTTVLDATDCRNHMYAHLLDVTGDDAVDLVCSGERRFPTTALDVATLPWQSLAGRLPSVNNVVDSVTGDFDNDGRMDLFLLSGVQNRPSGAAQHRDRRVEFRTQGGQKRIDFVSAGALRIDLDWNLLTKGEAFDHIFIGANGKHPSGLPINVDPADPASHGMPAPAPTGQTPAILIGFDPATNRWSVATQTNNKWSDAYIDISSTDRISNLNVRDLWATDLPASPTLLRSTPWGWRDATGQSGLGGRVLCASVTTGDYNNDMYLDLYLACRGGASNLPNRLYFGGPDGSFRAAPGAAGARGPLGTAVASRSGTADSAVSADFDLDGFLDLFVTNGFNMQPKGTGGPGKLFRNNGNGHHWVMLDLVGTTSARDAVGAKVTASASGVTQTRVQDGGYHRWSQHHARIHFGLATARQVDLVIDWPSGQRDVHRGVAADTLYRAIEGGALQSTGSGRQVEPGGVRCGRPSYDRDSQTGFYVWQACADGAWRARAVAGGRTIRYRGNLRADRDFSAVVPVDIESSDRVDASDPRNIVFDLTAVSRWEDGVNFAAPDAAAKCFTAWGTEGRVFVGADATPAPSSFDPESLAACGPSSP